MSTSSPSPQDWEGLVTPQTSERLFVFSICPELVSSIKCPLDLETESLIEAHGSLFPWLGNAGYFE